MSFNLQEHRAVDQVGIEERVARFNSRSIKGDSKSKALRLALSMIDLTTLEGKDTTHTVEQLCRKASRPFPEMPDLPTVAAVCVYPNHVKTAKHILANSRVKVASVSTAFPSGNSRLDIKLTDTRYALESGADEIDMVINRGAFLQGDYTQVFDEIAAIKSCCGLIRLKVILETGELGSLDAVRKASEIAINAGADFIKTSTGKIQPAANMPVTLVMLETIKDHYYNTGKMVGMKPAGGISTAKQAIQYLVMLNETLGRAWLDAQWFRFGASSLANDIILQLGKEKYGQYYSKDYFPIN
jgi:deoxyribose-phosphate aldolase